jgi:predicted metallopeptidase
MKRKKQANLDWKYASDIKKRTLHLIKSLKMDWININKIYFLRSNNSKAKAHARIWGLSRVWQMVLKQKPVYIIEVLSEKFDNLTEVEKNKVLLHELTHIPKNFSGSLLPHVRKKGKRNFYDKVNNLFKQLNK